MRSLRRGILCFGRRVAETSTTTCAGDDISALSRSSSGSPQGSGASIFNDGVEDGSRSTRGSLALGASGVLLSIIGYFIVLFDPYSLILKYCLSMSEGSFIFNLWRKPPVSIFLSVYVFNVTNSEAFLKGEERMRVQEIGPYVYREVLENTNINFGIDDDDSVTFEPKRTMHWEGDMSEGSLEDRIVVPNIALLGLSSVMSKSSNLVQLAFSSLANYLDSKPFLNISVEEYLWGHEEPLLTLAAKILPSWIPFDSLGLLDRLMDMGTRNITISIGRNDPGDRHRIRKVNGAEALDKWSWDRYPEPGEEELYDACRKRDTVTGAFDGILYPRHIRTDSPLRMYRDAFCRPLVLIYEGDVQAGGFSARRFRPRYGAFNDSEPENACVCTNDEDNCLPSGLSDVTPCFYRIPTAVSFPHLYQADSKLREEILGLSPDKDKHDTYLDIQPDVGVPLEAHSRVQLNLLVKDTRRIRRAAPFNGLIIPIAWTDLSLDSLPPSLLSTIHLAIVTLPIVQKGAIFIFSCSGAAMILACMLLECCSRVEKRNKTKKDTAKKWCEKPEMSSYQKAKQYVRVVPVVKDVKGKGWMDKSWIESTSVEQNETEHRNSIPLLKKVLPNLEKNCN